MPAARSRIALRVAAEDRPQHGVAGGAQILETCGCRAASTLSPVLRPSPGSRRTESGSSVSRRFCGVMTVSPSGFFRSEAIFATSLLGATPTEAVTRVVCVNAILDRAAR